jgi:tellurite resistance protein
MRISEIIHDRVERYRDRTFLKAAMAASALTAYADGSVSVTERFKVDEILERLERLHIYDAQKAVEKFEDSKSATPTPTSIGPSACSSTPSAAPWGWSPRTIPRGCTKPSETLL